MQNKGLLFIPDISGFTRFVNETEIEHSRIIIQELLELLINSNRIGLQVSEIEGDAILFYKYGELPDLAALYNQVAEMFCAFHRRIIAYDNHRFCQCVACKSAIQLTLKVITHYGEFTGYNVHNFQKLIGKDIIVAHQLLKNEIEQHEYWLVTQGLFPETDMATLPSWMTWNSSEQQTPTGPVLFQYTQLGQLKHEIPVDPVLKLDVFSKVKMLSFEQAYDASIIVVLHATGDFNYRSQWQVGVKKVEEVNHFLPRVGMRCRCIYESGEQRIYSSSYNYTPDHIEYSETDEESNATTYYTLEKLGPVRTKLTLEYFIPNNIGSRVFFAWMKKKGVERDFRQSLINLDQLVKAIKLPSESVA